MTPGDRRAAAIDDVLATLPRHTPAPQRSARTAERAHALMDRRERRRRFAGIVTCRHHREWMELALAGVCSLLYLSDVIRRAMRFYGF